MGKREVVAVGEIGMDLYWDKTFLREQQRVLDKQIEWALDLPCCFCFCGGYDLWYGSELAMGEYQFYGQSAARCDIHCHRQLSAEMPPELYNWYQAAMDTE